MLICRGPCLVASLISQRKQDIKMYRAEEVFCFVHVVYNKCCRKPAFSPCCGLWILNISVFCKATHLSNYIRHTVKSTKCQLLKGASVQCLHTTSSHWPANFPSAFFFSHMESECNLEKSVGMYFPGLSSHPKFYITLHQWWVGNWKS